MAKAPTVSVCPNPYHYVDADGVPCATYPEDPEFAGGARRWVGASICEKRTVVHSTYDARTGRAHNQTTVFVFDDGPHTRPATSHYLQGIRCGALLAADETSARMAGLCFDEKTEQSTGVPMWLPPEKARLREQDRALGMHKAHLGASATLKEPTRPLKSETETAKAPTTGKA
jgi:hypothetical protein